MENTKKIIKNTIYLLSSDVLTKTLGLIYTVYLAQYLGARDFGVLTFAIAFTGLFAILTDMGLSGLATREMARDKSKINRYASTIIFLKIVLVIITAVLTIISVNIFDYPDTTKLVVYIFILVIGTNSFIQVFNSILSACEMFEYVSIKRIINSLIMISGVFIGIYFNFNVINFSLVYLLANIAMIIYLLSISLKKLSLKIELDYNICGWLLKTSLPFALIGALMTIYYKIDSVMLSYYIGDSAVGYYNAAYTLVITLSFIPEAYLGSIYPLMSRLHTNQELVHHLNFLYRKSTKYMIGISLPICIGTSLLANKIIMLFFGNDFLPSTLCLQILIWSIFFMFLNLLFSNFLTSINKQSVAVKSIAIGVCINILLNYLMIPKLSFAGASIATVITEIVITVIYSKYLYNSNHGLGINASDLLKSLTSCAIMGVYIIFFININVLLVVSSSAILYILLLYCTGWFDGFEKTLVVSTYKYK